VACNLQVFFSYKQGIPNLADQWDHATKARSYGNPWIHQVGWGEP